MTPSTELLTIAIPKGKLYDPTARLLARAGMDGGCLEPEDSRRLVFESPELGLRYIAARPADVPTYVAHGAADLGVAGKDVLLEDNQEYAELLDLGFGPCRMMLAAAPGAVFRSPARVATKFPRIAEQFFIQKGWPVEIIYLHGAVELAPAAGLADAIVDIISTGETLRENNLRPLEEIAQCTARLIANPAALRLKREKIESALLRLRQVLKEA